MKKFLSKPVIIGVFLVLSASFLLKGMDVRAFVPGNITLVSENYTANGQGGNNNSGLGNSFNRSGISKSGRFVVFNSWATDIISVDTNATSDVFVRDTVSNTTERVNISSSGVEANDESEAMNISENGRYVLFRSEATNLIDGQTLSSSWRSYIHDRMLNSTYLISSSFNANTWTAQAISNDGRFVLVSNTFAASSNRVFVIDTLLSSAVGIDSPMSGPFDNASVQNAGMSCDGAFVVFESDATNLVPGDTNGYIDVFLADLRNGVKITNLTKSGNEQSFMPDISCNGNYVSFSSKSNNLVSGLSGNLQHIFLYDRLSEDTILVDKSSGGAVANSTTSYSLVLKSSTDDEGNVIFPSNATNLASGHNNKQQIYLRSASLNQTEILTKNSSGLASLTDLTKGQLSANGKYALIPATDASGLISGETNNYRDIMLAETGL